MDTCDPEAFRALYRDHHPTIRRYLAARAPASQVDDLAAETFLVAWRRFAQMPPHALPWLLNVAAKLLANQRRKTDRADELVVRLARVSRLDDPGAATAAERRAEHLAVLHALARLSASDRELMLLSVWDGLQAREIAVVVGVNPVATRARLSRARRRLEHALRAEFAAADKRRPRAGAVASASPLRAAARRRRCDRRRRDRCRRARALGRERARRPAGRRRGAHPARRAAALQGDDHPLTERRDRDG